MSTSDAALPVPESRDPLPAPRLPLPPTPGLSADLREVRHSENVREFLLRPAVASPWSAWDAVWIAVAAGAAAGAGASNDLTAAVLLGVTAALVLAVWVRVKTSFVSEESLLVVRDLGLQVQTRYYGGTQRTRFIDRAHVADVILNEGITFQSVIFYMAVVVEGQDRLLVVFENLRPRLDVLMVVYRGARAVMFNESELA